MAIKLHGAVLWCVHDANQKDNAQNRNGSVSHQFPMNESIRSPIVCLLVFDVPGSTASAAL